ncbi:TPA: hypothetical protein ACT2IF_000711 [Streptococcus suis]
MVKAIIFDMDGVLFDTETFYFQRRADFLATKGLSVDHLIIWIHLYLSVEGLVKFGNGF